MSSAQPARQSRGQPSFIPARWPCCAARWSGTLLAQLLANDSVARPLDEPSPVGGLCQPLTTLLRLCSHTTSALLCLARLSPPRRPSASMVRLWLSDLCARGRLPGTSLSSGTFQTLLLELRPCGCSLREALLGKSLHLPPPGLEKERFPSHVTPGVSVR